MRRLIKDHPLNIDDYIGLSIVGIAFLVGVIAGIIGTMVVLSK